MLEGGGQGTRSNEAGFIHFLLALVLSCGLLDATAVWNASSFGVGAYVLASGAAGALLMARSWLQRGADSLTAIPWGQLVAPLLMIVILWSFAWGQAALHPDLGITQIKQSTLRTIVAGHFVVCVLLLQGADRSKFVTTVLGVVLAIYIFYGLFDLLAQIFRWPRFLNFLRNSESVAITQSMGEQGWLRLPRIMGFAAEPSHTMMPLMLATYVFFRIGGRVRTFMIPLIIIFCIGTFARSVWFAFAGSLVLATVLHLGNKMLAVRAPRLISLFIAATALLLPFLMLYLPSAIPVEPGSDMSVLKRMDSSRAGFDLFIAHPLTGVGFEGWSGRPLGFDDDLESEPLIFFVLNGVAVYAASLGVSGLLFVCLPLMPIVLSRGLAPAAKGWWIGALSLSAFGGDYLVFPSTWTALAVALSWRVGDPGRPGEANSALRRAPTNPAA